MSMRGDSDALSVPAAVEMIRATPPGRPGSQTALTAVSHRADHLGVRVALPFPKEDVFADRIFIGENQLRQPLANDMRRCGGG
jgi:hypothetical protein